MDFVIDPRSQKLIGCYGNLDFLRDRTHLQSEVLADLLRSPECHLECLTSKTRQCGADLVRSGLKTAE